MAEADRIAEFKEVAVCLRRLEKAAGVRRVLRNQPNAHLLRCPLGRDKERAEVVAAVRLY